MAKLEYKCQRSSATPTRSSNSFFEELPAEIRLQIYSYLSELDLSRLIRVNKKIYKEGIDSLFASTQFTLTINDNIVTFHNAATLQDCETSKQMRHFHTVGDLPASFDRVQQLRFICYLDITRADEQRNLGIQAINRLLASKSPLKNLDISLFYAGLRDRQEIALAAQKLLGLLRSLPVVGDRDMANVIEHVAGGEDAKIKLNGKLME
jgi:hypothetical protein